MVVRGIDKKIYFGNKSKSKCWKCKKEVNTENGVVGYNSLFCKECYKKFSKQARAEVNRVFSNL